MRIQHRQAIAKDVIQLDLASADMSTLPAATPGSHVTLDLRGGLRRSYSLVDCAPAPQCYRIAVALESSGRGGSAAIHASLFEGAEVVLTPPRNDFPLDETAPHSLLLAGGIGVTPIHAMARRLAEIRASFSVHLAVRSRDRAVYSTALASYDPGFALHVDEEAGRVLDLHALIARQPDGTHFYCCGPPPMLASFLDATAHVPPRQVHFERFSSGAERRVSQDDSFEVYLQKSGLTVTVNSDQSILHVLRQHGIFVESSCEDGVCGSCETKVLSGEVEHHDALLSEAEKASSKTMMVCVSRCRKGRLVLDL